MKLMKEKKEILEAAISNASKLFDELISFFLFELNPEPKKFNKIDPLYPPLVYQNLLKIIKYKVDWILKEDPSGESENFISDIPSGYSWGHYFNNGESLELFPKGVKFCSDLPYSRAYFEYGRHDEEAKIRDQFKKFDFVDLFQNYSVDMTNFEIDFERLKDKNLDKVFEEFFNWKNEKVIQIDEIGRSIYGYQWFR